MILADKIFGLPKEEETNKQTDIFKEKIRETLLGIISLEKSGQVIDRLIGDIQSILARILASQETQIKEAETTLIGEFVRYIEKVIFTEENKKIRLDYIQEINEIEKRKEMILRMKMIQSKSSKVDGENQNIHIVSNLLTHLISSFEQGAEINLEKLEVDIVQMEQFIDKAINSQKIRELERYFNIIEQSTIDSIQGIYEFDSGKPGPNIGIGICTHGNEPAGLAVFKYFYDNNLIPENGKVTFVCNNLKATKEYFHDFGTRDTTHLRFKDTNMNRILSLDGENSNSYEIQRIKKLVPILKTFSHGIDIHSTLAKSTPMVLTVKGNTGYSTGFPIETVIHNMTNIQSGYPISRYFGGFENDIPVVGIECGQHENGIGFETALECVLQFQENIYSGKINQHQSNEKKHPKEFSVSSSIFFPKGFMVSRDFHEFEEVKPGTVLGETKNGAKIKTKLGGVLLFGKKKGYVPKNSSEEVFFLMQPGESELKNNGQI